MDKKTKFISDSNIIRKDIDSYIKYKVNWLIGNNGIHVNYDYKLNLNPNTFDMERKGFMADLNGDGLGLDDIMPFGKFKGEKLRDVDGKYLDWLIVYKGFKVSEDVMNKIYRIKK